MDHVQTILKNNIYEYILKPFINSVSVKYKINEKDLLDLLENINNLDQTKENVKVEKESVPTCPYMYTKGKLANTVCGVKLKKNSTFCSKHKMFKTKAVCEQVKEEVKEEVKENLVLRKHKKLNMLWHSPTSMVFDNEKKVAGVCKNNILEELTDEDIKICKEMSFAYKVYKKDDEKILNEIEDIETLLHELTSNSDEEFLEEEE